MRQTLRERRDASQMEDLLDDSIENELIDNKINHLLSEIHSRFEFFFTKMTKNYRNKQQWPKMTKNDQKWSKMIKNDQKWSKMIKNDQKWSKMIKNGQKWPKRVQYCLTLSDQFFWSDVESYSLIHETCNTFWFFRPVEFIRFLITHDNRPLRIGHSFDRGMNNIGACGCSKTRKN